MASRSAFKKIYSSRITWAVLAVLLSVILWVYVTDTEGEVQTRTFPGVQVEYTNEDSLRDSRNLIVTDINTNTIAVTLSGTPRNLSKLTSSSIKAVVDLSVITSAIRTTCAYELVLPSGVSESDIKVVSTSPEDITVTVQTLTSKYVDVKPSFKGSVAAGYVADTATFEPATVKIIGPQEELDLVDSALVTIERTDIDATLSYTTSYTLVDKAFNPVECPHTELETDEVLMTMLVESTKDVPLDVDIIAGGGATRETVKIDIDPATIKLSGDAAALDGLNRVSLGTIDLAEFETSYTETFPITIGNELTNLSGKTEAKVTVTVRGLETRTFSVTNMSTTGLPEGYTAEIYMESLDIRVRGSSATLNALAANNLRAVADLTDYNVTTGIIQVPVTIKIDADTTAGVVGEYKVYVILSNANESGAAG